MAVPICSGSFTKDAGTVTQTISNIRDKAGRSFQPTFIIFETYGYVGAGGVANADAIYSIGFDNFTSRRGMGARQGDGLSSVPAGPASAQKSTYHKTASIIIPCISSGTQNDIVGLASNPLVGSFDVVWSVSVSAFTNVRIHFTAFGGTVNADVGSVLSTSGLNTISGLSVDPTCVLMFAPALTADSAGVIDNFFNTNVGFFNDVGCQGTLALTSYNDAAFPSSAFRYQRSSKCLSVLFGGGVTAGSGPTTEAAFTSVGSGEFEITFGAYGLGVPIVYAAIEGVSMSVFPLEQPSAGVITFSGLGKTPDGVMFFSNGAASSSTVQTQGRIASETCNGSSQVAGWTGFNSAVVPTVTARYFDNTAGLISATPTASSASIESQISTVTFQTDGLRLAWGLADGTARQILALVWGAQTYALVSPCSPPTNSLPTYPAAPVSYEDPCDITQPHIYYKLETESDRYYGGTAPLREPSRFIEPRLLEVGPCVRQASDPTTGAWSAQTTTLKIADTDRVLRDLSEDRGSLRNCPVEVYLTSKAQSAAEGPPRVLFAGKAYGDSADEHMVLTLPVNDLIGVDYSLFNEEKQIPQRVITVNDFPLCPEDNLGLGVPIIGGTVSAFATMTTTGVKGPGVVDCITVGRVKIAGAVGTPGPGDLAAVVAALQAAVSAGTVEADFGPRIGYADAAVLQAMGTVPSTYAELGAIIGFADLDDLLAATATSGNEFVCVVLAGHAISELLATNASTPPGGPSIWIDDDPIDPAELGVSVWCPQFPGDTSWTTDIQTEQFTDIVGVDGTTRRYTLILFAPGSTYGDLVEAGSQVHVECVGMEDAGDGTGTPITNYWALYLHTLNNFLLQSYQTNTGTSPGGWLDFLQFFFSDGVTLLDRIDANSFTDADDITQLQVSGGYLGGFVLGSGGQRRSIRDVVADFNRSGGCLLAQDDYGRLKVQVLNTSRGQFLLNPNTGSTHRTLRDKVDILPGFRVEARPDWQVNQLAYQYAENYHEGKWDRGFGGGGNTSPAEDTASQLLYGIITKTMQFPMVRDDATATAVANYYLALLAELPRVAVYTRCGLCGLEDDLLFGVPITHYNGYGANGWQDHAVWVTRKSFNPKTMTCDFQALDVEHLLT